MTERIAQTEKMICNLNLPKKILIIVFFDRYLTKNFPFFCLCIVTFT